MRTQFLLFTLLLITIITTGCAEFLKDYSYSAGPQDNYSSASESGSRDPFAGYGAFGPSSGY